MKHLHTITSTHIWYVTLFLGLVVAGANILDTFLYYGAFQKYFLMDSRLLTTLWFGLALSSRYFLGEMPKRLSVVLKPFQLLGLPFALLTTLGFTYLEVSHFPNYVYSTWRIHYDQIFFFVVLFGGVTLIRQSESFFQQNWRRLMFAAPVIGLGIIHLMRNWPADYWLLQVNNDDAGIENLQVVSLAILSICSLALGKFLHVKRHRSSWLFTLTGLGAIFVLGEEISWGQRIFNIETPEALEKINTQGELTLHNISFFQNYLRLAYQTIAGLGLALAGVKWLGWLPSLQRKLPFLFPDRALIAWFAVFFFLDLRYGGNTRERWFEVAELILYTVFALHFLLLWAKREEFSRLKT